MTSSSVRGWLPSRRELQELQRDRIGRGRRYDFVPKGGDCSFAQVHSRDLKVRDLHRSEAIGRTTLLACPLLWLISVLPLQAMGLGIGETLYLWLSSV